MLKLDGLRLRAGSFSLTADLCVETGARVAILGPSGAGKSTLLAGIGGFLAPESGRILIDGTDVTAAAPGVRPVATLFQDANLFPHLTLAQNVGLGLHPSPRLSQHERRTVEAALDRVGLSGLGARKPRALSGGQQSRAALARVLLQQRRLLLLDEPFAALGPGLKVQMLDLVADVLDQTGSTLLMVTHDPADATRLTPRTVLVAEGRARPPVPTLDMLADPPDVLRAYLG